MWNNFLAEIVKYLTSVDVKWNLPTFASANISHLRSKYFTAKLFHLPARANFVEKSTHCLGRQMCAFFWRRRRDSLAAARLRTVGVFASRFARIRSLAFCDACHSLALPLPATGGGRAHTLLRCPHRRSLACTHSASATAATRAVTLHLPPAARGRTPSRAGNRRGSRLGFIDGKRACPTRGHALFPVISCNFDANYVLKITIWFYAVIDIILYLSLQAC